jgi:hypothetical protein
MPHAERDVAHAADIRCHLRRFDADICH